MKIDLEAALWSKVKRYADTAGYGSPEEFVQHAVQRHLDVAMPESQPEATSTFKGLGYLDLGRDI